MWIGAIGFQVKTKNAKFAGTDSLVTVEILRDNKHLFTGKLDFAFIDDLEPGDNRFYGYTFKELFFDKTPPLPDGVGQSPAPYPSTGMEFSSGLKNHLKCRLRIHNDDMWTKDQVDIFVKQIQKVADGFDLWQWKIDANWTHLGAWTKDVNLSTDSSEGVTTLTLNFS